MDGIVFPHGNSHKPPAGHALCLMGSGAAFVYGTSTWGICRIQCRAVWLQRGLMRHRPGGSFPHGFPLGHGSHCPVGPSSGMGKDARYGHLDGTFCSGSLDNHGSPAVIPALKPSGGNDRRKPCHAARKARPPQEIAPTGDGHIHGKAVFRFPWPPRLLYSGTFQAGWACGSSGTACSPYCASHGSYGTPVRLQTWHKATGHRRFRNRCPR